VGQLLALIKDPAGGDVAGSGPALLGRTAWENPPHHGSRYTSVAFLNAVSPRAVLVSVGAGNRYRHPDPGLIGGLERAGASMRRTDLAGDVAVVGGSADLELVSRGSPLPAPR
jgi:competence protein ComEC